MSRHADESRSRDAKPKKTKKSSYGPYVSFHPDKAEKSALQADATSLEDLIYELVSYVEKGHQLTLKWVEKHSTFQAGLRQGGVVWTDALTATAHHSDPEKALRALRYALRHKWPEFPLVGDAEGSFDDEW